MQYAFGSGSLFITPTGADGLGAAGPRRVGAVQGVSLDFSGSAKDARTGASRWSMQGARGAVRVQGKADFARFTADGFNALFFGGPPPTPGMTRTRVDEAHTIAAGAATADNDATFTGDLGVIGDDGAVYTRVAAGPVGAQYTMDGAGGYGFDAARNGARVAISYTYDDPASGFRIGVENRIIGRTPTFSLVLTEVLHGKAMTLTLPYCTAGKMAWNARPEDFTVPSFTFNAAADDSGLVGTWSMEEGADVPVLTPTIPTFWFSGGLIVEGSQPPVFSGNDRIVTHGPLDGLVNAYAEVNRRRKAGKYYAEVVVLSRSGLLSCTGDLRIIFKGVAWDTSSTAPQQFEIGLGANAAVNYHSRGGGTYFGPAMPMTETHPFTGNPRVATGAVIGVAIDTAARSIWVRYNGEWVGGGDPALGVLPSIVAPEATDSGMTIVLQMHGSSNTGASSWKINLATQHLAYPAPAGFRAWGDSDYTKNDAT